MATDETLFLLSHLRMGTKLGRIKDIDIRTINELFYRRRLIIGIAAQSSIANADGSGTAGPKTSVEPCTIPMLAMLPVTVTIASRA